MEKEISNGAMLGIVLIALAAIIGLGFGVFSIAKGTANDGVTGVQENLGAVGNSAFTDFDQKIVTGTQVSSGLQNFEGKPYAILIATQALKDNTTTTVGVLESNGAGLDKYGSGANFTPPTVAAYTEANMVSAMMVHRSTDSNANGTSPLTFMNYNTLLGLNDTISPARAQMYFDQNCWRALKGFKTVSGKVQMNGITGNISKSGMVEFVPSGSRFQAYLIKDLSGTIMGIAFEQLNSK